MKWMRSGVAVLAVLFLCSDAFADDLSRWYLAVKGGAYSPETSSAAPVSDLDNGMIGEIAAGFAISRNLAIEAGFAGYNAEKTLPSADVSDSTIRSISATAFLVTVKGVFPVADGKIDLSAGAGIGSYKMDIEFKDPPPPPVDMNVSETETGYHLTAGIDYNFTPRFALGLDYRWFTVEVDNVDLGGDVVSLAVKYRF